MTAPPARRSPRVPRAVLAACLLVGTSACSATPQPAPAPPSHPAPAVSLLPASSGQSGCVALQRPSCQAWSPPQPADLPWGEVTRVADQTRAGRNVGAAYLCAAVDEDTLHTLAGPDAVRAQDGAQCLLSSVESLNWIPSERGTVHADLAIDPTSASTHATPQRPVTHPAGHTVVVDTAARNEAGQHRLTGWIAASAGSVHITVTTSGLAAPRPVWDRLQTAVSRRTA